MLNLVGLFKEGKEIGNLIVLLMFKDCLEEKYISKEFNKAKAMLNLGNSFWSIDKEMEKLRK